MEKVEMQYAIKRLEASLQQLMALGASSMFSYCYHDQDEQKIWVYMREEALKQIAGDREEISWENHADSLYPYKIVKVLQGVNFYLVSEKPPKVILGRVKASEKNTLFRQAAGELSQAVHDLWALHAENKRRLDIHCSYQKELTITHGSSKIHCSLLMEAAS